MTSYRLALAAAAPFLLLATACNGDDAEPVPDAEPTIDITADPEATEDAPTETPTESSDVDAEEVPTQDGVDPWRVGPAEFRDEIGSSYAFTCPAGGEASATIWGTGTYTDDSAVCVAGVHAGAITVEDGGVVVITMVEPLESYEASEANGIASSDYGPWAGAYVVEVD